MLGEAELTTVFEDDVFDVSNRRGGGGGSRNKRVKVTATSNAAGAGRIPRIVDVAALAGSKSATLLPRVETTMTTLRTQLGDVHKVFENEKELAASFEQLLRKGVSESQIDASIKDGSDEHGLDNKKSLYKCCFQFYNRIKLAAALIGLDVNPDLSTVKFAEPSKHREELRDMAQTRGLKYVSM